MSNLILEAGRYSCPQYDLIVAAMAYLLLLESHGSNGKSEIYEEKV